FPLEPHSPGFDQETLRRRKDPMKVYFQVMGSINKANDVPNLGDLQEVDFLRNHCQKPGEISAWKSLEEEFLLFVLP
ncbi:hypothetical protein, partial [Methanoregula sp.]|uniref:hypothetical protein n=1 Tax=Methanoregula sp. TaxID=2052170 RepID=UPI003C77BFFD